MTIRQILVPCFPEVEFGVQLTASLNLARQVEAHINAVFVSPDPQTVLAAIPAVSLAAGVSYDSIAADYGAAAAEAEAKFTKWRLDESLAADMVDVSLRSPYAGWFQRTGEIAPIVARCGRLSDLIVLMMPDGSHPATGKAFDAAVFESGRLTLLVPPRDLPSDILRHVVIAWSGELEATRAIAGAMTLLHEAEKVSIFTTLDEDALSQDLDLAEFLSWHGINPRYFRPKADECSVGKALMRVVADVDATMLVMGAYTHSRIQETLLGGVTRYVLGHTPIPVLMMH